MSIANMSKEKPHGALGSNAPIARVPVEPEDAAAQPQPTMEKEDNDVVYLRDDLRSPGG